MQQCPRLSARPYSFYFSMKVVSDTVHIHVHIYIYIYMQYAHQDGLVNDEYRLRAVGSSIVDVAPRMLSGSDKLIFHIDYFQILCWVVLMTNCQTVLRHLHHWEKLYSIVCTG
jgi:hypothetical protein